MTGNETIAPADTAEPRKRDIWDKADIIGKLTGSILIPVVVASTGIYVNAALQERASKQKTFEIAITILQSKDSSIPQLKAWAQSVFAETVAGANQPLPAAAQKELSVRRLPTSGVDVVPDITAKMEGFSAVPYKDPIGQWVIGYGHTRGVGPDTPAITETQAKAFLADDMQYAFRAIDESITVPLSRNQRSALADLIWQIGAASFKRSSLVKAINDRNVTRIPVLFMAYNKVGRKISPGLTKRREADIALWNEADGLEGPPPPPP
jgi:lysozyme